MLTNLTQAQLDKIQIDEGLVYANYGEVDEVLVGPSRGGAEFSVIPTVRKIEFDGQRGNEKGMKVIEEVNASLKVTTINTDQSIIDLAIVDGSKEEVTSVITSTGTGVIPSTKYLTNITMFAKLADGTFKKITIYNALNEGNFTLNAQPKAEGEVEFEFNAHWDPTDTTQVLYQIEDTATIS